MKKVICVSKKEKSISDWSHAFKIFGIYSVELEDFNIYRIHRPNYWVDKAAFIEMRMIWSSIAFIFILFLAMAGESIIDWILLFLVD